MTVEREHRPRKRFGQNFLHDPNVLDKIVSAADIKKNEHVLEIGPGMGALTDLMLPLAGEVAVMEVDRDLASRMRERNAENLVVHEGDALSLPWHDILIASPYKLVANLPYNISSQILFKILDHRSCFSRLVLMFQKEVGDRLCASPGTKDYGILSVFCQLHYDMRRVVVVPPGAFFPPPKVYSVVVLFDPLPSPRVPLDDEDLFRRVVKGAFSQRRKTLRNALKSAGFLPESIDRLSAVGIDPSRRGETLTLEEFSLVTRTIQERK